MRLAEEFSRCEKCGGGWFKIETRVLIDKASGANNPMHYKEEDHYNCVSCGRTQYIKTKQPE